MLHEITLGWWTLMIVLAVVVDWIVGDPRKLPHPVVLIGKTIGFLTKKLNKGKHRRGKGLFMWIIVIILTAAATLTLQWLCTLVHPAVYVIFNIWFLSTTLAEKSLRNSVADVSKALRSNDIPEARKQVGWLVGRDTTQLDQHELIRATVETTAENTIDGVLAPLFYMVIGAVLSHWFWFLNPLCLAMIYKAVNTMDSMVGYKIEPYTEFGYHPAMIDDVFNYVIARLGSELMLFSGYFTGFDVKNGRRIYKRDCNNHKSPNSGHPESAAAGLLGIQIGGTNVYFGQTVVKPTIGDEMHPLTFSDIDDTISIMIASEIIMTIICGGGLLILAYFGGI